MVDHAVADDAGANDDDIDCGWDIAQLSSPADPRWRSILVPRWWVVM